MKIRILKTNSIANRFDTKHRTAFALDTYLILSKDLGYGETGMILDSLEEISRLLNAYSKTILDSYSGS
jgi:hypothetical protein